METDAKKETSTTPTKAQVEVHNEKRKPFSSLFYHNEIDLSSPDNKLCGIPQKTCAKCGKTFVPAPYHRYKERERFYCTWPCYLHRNDGANHTVINGKPVEQYTMDGVYVATFASTVEAAKEIGLKRADNIRDCCKGKTKSSAGFVWRYQEVKK